MKIDIVTQ